MGKGTDKPLLWYTLKYKDEWTPVLRVIFSQHESVMLTNIRGSLKGVLKQIAPNDFTNNDHLLTVDS